MGKYQGYEKYKDSEVEWLGEIPETWQMIRFKFLIDTRKGVAFKSSDFIDIGCRVVKASDIKNYSILESDIYLDPFFKKEYPKAILKEGEIVLSTVGSTPDVKNSAVGQVAIVPKNLNQCLLNQNTVVFTPHEAVLFNKFLFYILISNRYRDHLDLYAHGTANQASLNITDMLSFQSAIPPLEEQEKIARFLDYKTKQIDELIAKKETLIEKLDEKRTALISHAVTKGLDPSVSMKDSGIEWLGEIPQHWNIVRLKYLSSGVTVGIVITPAKYYVESGISCLRSLNIKENRIDGSNLVFISEESNEILSKSKIYTDDLVAVRTGQPGTTAVVTNIFNGTNCIDLIIIRKSNNFISRFLCYQLNSPYCKHQFTSGTDGAIQQHFNIETACNLLIVIPQLKEQEEITKYLEQKTAEIDQQKAKIQKAIELLKEYRTALITNAVTGKIDVRQVPIP